MNLLFLDIDGVLNGHEWSIDANSCQIKPECVRHLNQILRETEAKVVLSSAWRYMLLETEFGTPAMTLAGFEYLMRTHGVAGFNLIGTTESDEAWGWNAEENQFVRGKQIRGWLGYNRRKLSIDGYCILDDDDLGISALHKPFVRTDGRVGLTAEKAAEVIRWLNGEAKS